MVLRHITHKRPLSVWHIVTDLEFLVLNLDFRRSQDSGVMRRKGDYETRQDMKECAIRLPLRPVSSLLQ